MAMRETPPPDDPTPPVGEVAPKKRERLGINWHRVRVYCWSIVLMVSMWLGATMVTIRLYPKRMVDSLLSQLPYSYSVGDVSWINRRTLQIDDVKIGGFFYARSIIVTASPFGLLRRHVAKVQIFGGQLFTGPLYKAMEQNTGSGDFQGWDWVIGQLEISRGTVMLDHLIEDTSIPVRLGVRHPIILRTLHLGRSNNSASMNEERTVEIGTVNIPSPLDPLAPVLAFPLTRVRFTYDELWHHHIREIDLVRPTMYLGEDLFWFTKQFREGTQPATAQGPEAPWTIGHFEVQFGQLAVNVFGQTAVHLPFYFDTKVDNIRLDQLDRISAKASIPIRRLSQDYTDYKIRIVDLTGQLYFSLPPSDANANNVVNTISIKEISWNDIPVKDVSSTVTFDPEGVYGKLSGKCEGGQLTGNFEFYYSKGFTWNADFFADKVNSQPIAEKLAGKYFELSGQLNGKIGVQGRVTDILNCSGTLDLPNPGTLEFKSMDGLLDRLPPDTIALKRQALQLAIDSFKQYPYRSGQVKIDYKPTGGTGSLRLNSPLGERLFQINYHPYTVTEDK